MNAKILLGAFGPLYRLKCFAGNFATQEQIESEFRPVIWMLNWFIGWFLPDCHELFQAGCWPWPPQCQRHRGLESLICPLLAAFAQTQGGRNNSSRCCSLNVFFYISKIFLYLGNGRVQENVQTHGSKAITQMINLLSSLKYLHKRRFRFPDLINIFVYMNVSRLNPFDRWESVTKLSWTKIPLKWTSGPRVQIIMGVTWKLSRSMILDWQRTCQSWYWCQLLLRFPWMPTSSLQTSHSELEPQPDQPVKYWKGGGDKL